MMTTTTKAAYINKWKYSAIALPLTETLKAGSLIIVLPKHKTR